IILDAHLDIWNRHANGAGFMRPIERIFGNNRAGLAQTVTFDERNPESLFEIFQNLSRQWRGAADANANGEFARKLGVDEAAIKLRERRQDGGTFRINFLDEIARGMQRFYDDDGATHEQ